MDFGVEGRQAEVKPTRIVAMDSRPTERRGNTIAYGGGGGPMPGYYRKPPPKFSFLSNRNESKS